MDRLALEAELTAKEKATKKTAKKTTKKAAKKVAKKTTRKTKTTKAAAAKSEGRLKLVWRVFSPTSKVIATFAYPAKDEAEAKAAKMTEKSGEEHRVRGVKIPLEEEI